LSSVGIIANPAAGKDIRRLVAQGRVVSDQEKSNTVIRIYAGLAALGVDQVIGMPEPSGLMFGAMNEFEGSIATEFVDMPRASRGSHSTRAARAMTDAGVGCIIVLGGDGTNRNVAASDTHVPLVPISTGTNNVFPQMVEGTLAGLAAGAIATGRVSRDETCKRSKRLEIFVDGKLEDIALVDAAISKEMFAGTRAIWDLDTVSEVYLTRAEPACIGISALGASLKRVKIDEPVGLHIILGDENSDRKVLAPVGPGSVETIGVADWSELAPGDRKRIELRPGMVALDGEREVSLLPNQTVEIALSMEGPWVADTPLTLEILAGKSSASIAESVQLNKMGQAND
jgi:predicted polyphosphate/ATP-dependent NAD kinase